MTSAQRTESRDRSGPQHWAKHWGQQEYRKPIAHIEILTAIRRATGGVRGRRILEIGAGMGGDSIALADEGAVACAVDYLRIALQSIGEFAGRERAQVRRVQADALALPFADEMFDAVFHQGLLEHFNEQEQALLLRENWRVLKCGGVLVVDVPQKFSEYTWYKRKLMRKGEWFAGWETEFSPRGLMHRVRSAGFSVHGVYPREYFGVVGRLQRAFAVDRPRGRGRWVPHWLRKLYRRFWQWLEKTPAAVYLSMSVGVIGEKPRI